ncbi:hypothetical protein B0T26DRAFT_40033 [Lasiosphaeria miniovina]|uniref:Uncharacterized protein n=1 Tax=Lasiosphaeria miniovina TaxID=1954250 RepID=A0AA40BGK9_9PEZI|nr:uncharacterized protein B0T26DRAFT_40033 [Lasiosphaeria miniovina]KAK0733860.1 hypothetical protein B0T26DRAFT_40033 [Lasiosphaeria miniovina]
MKYVYRRRVRKWSGGALNDCASAPHTMYQSSPLKSKNKKAPNPRSAHPVQGEVQRHGCDEIGLDGGLIRTRACFISKHCCPNQSRHNLNRGLSCGGISRVVDDGVCVGQTRVSLSQAEWLGSFATWVLERGGCRTREAGGQWGPVRGQKSPPLFTGCRALFNRRRRSGSCEPAHAQPISLLNSAPATSSGKDPPPSHSLPVFHTLACVSLFLSLFEATPDFQP